jgi:Ni,Fe-hydrogenase III component G
MSQETVLGTIKRDLSDKLTRIDEVSTKRIYLYTPPENVHDVCKAIFEEYGGRFATASGVDTLDGIEILYHFSFDSEGRMVTVKTKISRSSPEIKSIAPFLPAAEWIEREISDLLGVKFIDHPDPRRFILADDWPEGVYPLRKDFKGLEQ